MIAQQLGMTFNAIFPCVEDGNSPKVPCLTEPTTTLLVIRPSQPAREIKVCSLTSCVLIPDLLLDSESGPLSLSLGRYLSTYLGIPPDCFWRRIPSSSHHSYIHTYLPTFPACLGIRAFLPPTASLSIHDYPDPVQRPGFHFTNPLPRVPSASHITYSAYMLSSPISLRHLLGLSLSSPSFGTGLMQFTLSA